MEAAQKADTEVPAYLCYKRREARLRLASWVSWPYSEEASGWP